MLASGGRPENLSREALIAHDVTRALVDRHDVSDTLYAEAKAIFGDAGLVAMTHLIGLYLSVCAVLVAFRVPVPSDRGA